MSLADELKNSPLSTFGALCSVLALIIAFDWSSISSFENQPHFTIVFAVLMTMAWIFPIAFLLNLFRFPSDGIKIGVSTILLMPAGFYFGYQSDLWFNNVFPTGEVVVIIIFFIRIIFFTIFTIIYASIFGDLAFSREIIGNFDSKKFDVSAVAAMLGVAFFLCIVMGVLAEKSL